MKALFDTNVLIDFLAGKSQARSELALYKNRKISVISWIEVMVGAADEEETEQLRDFLSSFEIVALTNDIANEAVNLRKAHKIKLPDAIIWASARIEDSLFVTRNSKDFPVNMPGLRMPYQL